MSIKQAILASLAALPFEVVAVPEFGEGMTLKVSVMSVGDRDAFDAAYRAIDEADRANNFRSLLTIFTVKDNEGVRVFSIDDLEQVKQLSSLVVMRLSDVALSLNKMLKDDVEAHEKN